MTKLAFSSSQATRPCPTVSPRLNLCTFAEISRLAARILTKLRDAQASVISASITQPYRKLTKDQACDRSSGTPRFETNVERRYSAEKAATQPVQPC